MAEKGKKKEEETQTSEETPKAPKGPLILRLVNTLTVVAALGLILYTKVLYKRPAITESLERENLEKKHTKKQVAPGHLQFEPITVNIQSSPSQPKTAEGTPNQIHGKLHYANVGFSLAVKDAQFIEQMERVRPFILDKVLSFLGRKTFQELSTVQGRYILRSQILEASNQIVSRELQTPSLLITQVYFTQFTVQ